MNRLVRISISSVVVLLSIVINCAGSSAIGAPLTTSAPIIESVRRSQIPSGEMLLAGASAGKRTVLVGDRGLVLLSEDGKTFHQAKTVPTQATLTAVNFVDESHGWTVGHWGSILTTSDGGETWQLQRSDVTNDRPLFSVFFQDRSHGIAVGLWSLVLVTEDGGRSWREVTLPPMSDGKKPNLNLFHVFADSRGAIFVAAERGVVLRSQDKGASWEYVETGYKGSLWSGTALRDGTIIVAGLRGTLYKSSNGGQTWVPAQSGTKSSITGVQELPNQVLAVGLDGTILSSTDGGSSYSVTQRDDRIALTAIVERRDDSPLLLSKGGMLFSPTGSPR